MSKSYEPNKFTSSRVLLLNAAGKYSADVEPTGVKQLK